MAEHPRRTFLAALTGIAALPWLGRLPGPARARQAAAGQPGLDWPAQVPALAQQVSGHPLAYLDNAATTLRPRAVIDALVRYYEHDNANPSAALHTLARRSAAAQDAARARVARFVNAGDPREIVFTRGTTEGLNLVAATWGAASVKAGDEILLTGAEHASNQFPWERLAAATGARVKTIGVADDGRLRLDELDAALTSRTRVVAVAHVSNVLGIVNPVAEIAAAARRRGAVVVIDAAQSAPHVRLDVQTLGADFVAFSSHKMLGPMGVGVLWASAEHLKSMPAYHAGSNMAHGHAWVSASFEPGALRFQAGTPNVSGPVGLAAALDVLDGYGLDTLLAHDAALSAHGLARLQQIPGLRLLGSAGPANRVPVFTFTLAGVTVPEIVAAADAAGVAVRGGDMAALPLLTRFGTTVAARASAYVYNTTEEIDRLAEVLHDLAKRPRSAPAGAGGARHRD